MYITQAHYTLLTHSGVLVSPAIQFEREVSEVGEFTNRDAHLLNALIRCDFPVTQVEIEVLELIH